MINPLVGVMNFFNGLFLQRSVVAPLRELLYLGYIEAFS